MAPPPDRRPRAIRTMAKKKRPASALEDDASAGASSSSTTVAGSSPSPKFGQTLASNDKATRDKAVKALSRYLKSGRVTEELELAKIWKALFYCMWHSDKPKVQAELAERLGGLVHAVPGSRATLFAKVFWATMMREWMGIDRLRLNKFYTLQRCVLQQSFRQLRQAGWPAGGADALAQVLWQGPLSKASPPGLRYWMVDNYVPALTAELKADTAGDVWMALLEPLFLALGSAPDSHSLQRTSEGTVKALLAMRGGKGKADGDGDEDDEDDGGDDEDDADDEVEPPPGLPIELAQLAERLFSLASDRTTREANRQHLYALQEKVEQLVREAGGGATKAASATAKAATAAKAAAARADPTQVSTLLKLIGGKAGAKTGAKAGEKAQPTPRAAAAAEDEAPKASSTKKKRRVEAADDEPEEEPAAPAPKAAKAPKTSATAASSGAPKKKKVAKVKAGAKGKL